MLMHVKAEQMGTAKPKTGACVHGNICPINIAPGHVHVPVPGRASAANNPGPGSVRLRRKIIIK
jgi:hypothetical protein